MKKHALVVGSQTGDLQGVYNDTAAIEALLRSPPFGFEVALCTRDEATQDGIRRAYEALIKRCGPEDIAVVFYAGHGLFAALPDGKANLQCIAPLDLDKSSDTDFRGITSWELSILQKKLTNKTPNVTVILDCCHSSQMSRDAAARRAIPRAMPSLARFDVPTHLAALKDRYQGDYAAVDVDSNPNAVRVVAADQNESSYEYLDRNGKYVGVFTEALVAALNEVGKEMGNNDGKTDVTWVTIGAAVRAQVQRYFAIQRPSVEGPIHRRVFSANLNEDSGATTIVKRGDRYALSAGRLSDVQKDEVYGVMPANSTSYNKDRAIAEVTVDEPLPLIALLKPPVFTNDHKKLNSDVVAFPIVRNAIKRPVAVEVSGPARDAVERAFVDAKTLRMVAPDEAVIGKLRLVDDNYTVEDSAGPLFPPTAKLEDAIPQLKSLGVAQAMRELEGEHEVFRCEITAELGVVENGAPRPLPAQGAALSFGDRFYIKVTNRKQRRLYVHIFNIGLQGTVTLLTTRAPDGAAIDGGASFMLGERPDGTLIGKPIEWPKTLRQDGPRADEYVVIVTSQRISLATLETKAHGLGGARSRGTPLHDLMSQLHDGQSRDTRDEDIEGFLALRLWFMLYPQNAALGGVKPG